MTLFAGLQRCIAQENSYYFFFFFPNMDLVRFFIWFCMPLHGKPLSSSTKGLHTPIMIQTAEGSEENVSEDPISFTSLQKL